MIKALLIVIVSSIFFVSICCKNPVTFRKLLFNSCSSNAVSPGDAIAFNLASTSTFSTPVITSSHPMLHSWLQRWLFGLVAVSIISFGSTLGYFVFALKNIDLIPSLEFAKGLGFGSLIGSALFHLIPHSFGLIGQDPQHHYLWESSIIFLGIFSFNLFERIAFLISTYSQAPSNTKSNAPSKRNYCCAIRFISAIHAFLDQQLCQDNPFCLPQRQNRTPFLKSSLIIEKDENLSGHPNPLQILHNQNEENRIEFRKNLASIILWSDAFHNFIDGLSLGAALADDLLTGFSIFLAILCEEIPHELGEFAILLSSGMTRFEAASYNFLSASSCYVGMTVGLSLGDLTSSSSAIFAYAAEASFKDIARCNVREGCKLLLMQNSGILLGSSILLVLAKYGEYLEFAVSN